MESIVSDAVTRPSHVPESLVYDFDFHFDPEYLRNPHQRIIEILSQAPPIFWTPRNGGHWMLVGHEANFNAARDTEAFSSEIIPHEDLEAIIASMPPDAPRIPLSYPINLDPPLHAKYRQPLQRVFAPKTINALRGKIRSIAIELIESVVDSGSCEFMSAVAEPLPVRVFLEMLGLPLERLPEYRALVQDHLSQTEEMHQLLTMQGVAAAMRDTIIERRDNPKDDIISLLWTVDIDGRPATMEDIENYGVLLFVAGLDTVMQGMGHGMKHLAEDKKLQKRLRDNPEMIRDASEELLRRYTFTVPPRRVNKDIEFMGVEMKKNDRAMLFLPGADLDPAEFANSDQFDMDRDSKVHIAFNAGPHRCLGSHLARIELEVLYEEWLARIQNFTIKQNTAVSYHGGHVIGVDSMELEWSV